MNKCKPRPGRPPLPPDQHMQRRSIGMLASDWDAANRLRAALGVRSVAAVLRVLVRDESKRLEH